MQVCNLSASEVVTLEQLGTIPDCGGGTHDHIQKALARHLVASGQARVISTPKKPAITATRGTTARGYDLAAGRKDDLDWERKDVTMQMVHGGGFGKKPRWKPLVASGR
jgi:hypothetical protein